jgi:hypothetical protein
MKKPLKFDTGLLLSSREEIRRKKHLAQRQHEEEKKLSLKIAKEERKILIAQRKLESMRLLEELFNRVKVKFLHHRLLSFTQRCTLCCTLV